MKKLERQAGKKIKVLRQDNAGENKAMEKELIQHELECEVEITAAQTPQQNSRLETALSSLPLKRK